MIICAIAVLSVASGVTGTNTTMTNNLKVLVSSNDFPESGLKILKQQSADWEGLRIFFSNPWGQVCFSLDDPSVCADAVAAVILQVLQSRYNHFGEEGITQNSEELFKLVSGCSAIVWISHHSITKELLDKAGPSLKVIASVSAGYNHCNVEELKVRGIKLSNTPKVLDSAVAETAIGLMLGAGRRFTEALVQVRSGEWEIGFDKMLGLEIRGSTVGIIGFGGIGQAIAKRLPGFEVSKILYTGHREKPEGKTLGVEFVALDDLLSQSDFVILSVPLNDETRHMMNTTTLNKMKKTSILINVGRGDLVDQDALYNSLKNKVIYAAGLDVTSPEPLPKDHQLLTLPNVFILPHIGSATVRTRNDMSVLAANNVVNALNGKPLITPVLP